MSRAIGVFALGAAILGSVFAGCSSDDPSSSAADSGSDTSLAVDAAACTTEQVKCGDTCVVLASDHDNCGACGTACGDGEACRAGACASCADLNLDTCGPICTDITTDSANCGGCGKACRGGESCENGACVTACDGGVACGTSCVDVQTDPAHCGDCTNGCGVGQTCTAGICQCADANLVSCGGTCTDPRTDKNHCGATLGCATTAGFAGEKCVANGVCQDSVCGLCQSWTQGVTMATAGTNPVDIALQDFNGDGKLDVAVLDGQTSKVQILLGQGDGTFSVGAVVTVGAGGSSAMRIGDFDGDSKLDIAAVSRTPTNTRYVMILVGVGDGTFVAGPLIDHVKPAETIAAADINGDGRLDLVVGGGGFTGTEDIHTYTQNADHTYLRSTTDYAPIVKTALGTGYGFMSLADADQDGHVDLLMTAGHTGVFFGDGTGAFALGWTASPFGTGGRTLLVADLNADGKSDLLLGANTGVTFVPGAGGRAFGATSGVLFPDAPSTSLRDVTGDGVLDLVATASGPPAVIEVRAGKGDGSFLPAVSFPFDQNANGPLAFGDVNGDGRVDIVGLTFTNVRVLLGAKSTAAGCP